jgi:hypothetical protein
MARDFTLDTQAAKEANSGGKLIKESGAYVGTFKAAWYEQNDRGTESVQFLFESHEGQEAGPLPLYTHNGQGEPLPSFKTFHAILTCMKLHGVRSQPGAVDLYDFDSHSTVRKNKAIYPELMGKSIGVVFQREEYEKRSGDVGERLLLIGAFEPGTRRMAAEILDNKEAKALDGLLRWLDSHPVKMHTRRGQSHQPQSNYQPSSASGGFSDDIPFASIPRRQLW